MKRRGLPKDLAARVGVTDAAIRVAIREGRLPAQRKGRGWFFPDLDEAEARWKELHGVPRAERVAPAAVVVPAAPAPPSSLGDTYEGQTIDDVRAIAEFWRAKKSELEYRKAAGELVEIAEVQAAYADEVAACRSKLLGVPSRFRQRAKLSAKDYNLLESFVREALEELGSNPP